MLTVYQYTVIRNIFYNFQGKGVPLHRMDENNQAVRLSVQSIPNTKDAVDSYESVGGQLTLSNQVGSDPLAGRQASASLRLQLFTTDFPDLNMLFNRVSNNDYSLFQDAIVRFVYLTKNCWLCVYLICLDPVSQLSVSWLNEAPKLHACSNFIEWTPGPSISAVYAIPSNKRQDVQCMLGVRCVDVCIRFK